MQKMIAFLNVWDKLVKTELKPIITVQLDKKGCFFACLLYCIIELFIGHIFGPSGSKEEIVVALFGRFVSCNFTPISGTLGESS
jgi:hypothetical protein